MRSPILVLAAALLAGGCVATRPFAEVRGSLPQDRFVRVGDQLVYVEQAGAGEPVVLLHGFGASSYTWRQVVPGLAESHRVLAVDLNGFGWTERPAARASYTREGQMALVLGVLDALEIGRAHLVGSSYGGALALWLALEHPERVRSLVLVDSAAPAYFDERRTPLARLRPLARLFLRGWALRPRNVRASLRASVYDDAQVTPDLVAAYGERLRVEGVEEAYLGLVGPVRSRLPAFDYRRVAAPTLVVWGEEDELIPIGGARRTVAAIPGAEFVAMPRTGHLPMEERPQELLEIVRPFLARHAGHGAASGATKPDRTPAVDADGHTLHATFSLCAIDPETGESGVVVTTRVPFVGRAVPWVRAGVGAVATQAWTVVEYGRQGLDLLEQGLEPRAVIDRLLADDAGRERRQVGVIDMQGRTAAHTGKENGDWAGSRQGTHYTVQGNILVGREVIDAVADHFEASAGTGMPLAERLILALAAGQRQGGDRRWGLFQSAALRVADPNDPGRGGDHLSVSIDVGEHADPVAELERIYRKTQQRLGWRSFSEVRGRDVVELLRMLHALGHWRPDLAAFPPEPSARPDPALLRSDPERFRKELGDLQAARERYLAEYGLYDGAAMDAVDAFRKDHGLVHEGNPRGLVDERLVAALRAAYQKQRPAAATP